MVRAQVYERLQRLLPDNLHGSKQELAILVERGMKEYDEKDPTLKVYQHD